MDCPSMPDGKATMAKDKGGPRDGSEGGEALPVVPESTDSPAPATDSAPDSPSDSHSGQTSDSPLGKGTKLSRYGQAFELIGHQGVSREQVNSETRYQREWGEHESQDWPSPRKQQEVDAERSDRLAGSAPTDGADQPAERRPDPEGSWRDAKSDRYLTPEQNAEVNTRYEVLRECADRYGDQMKQIAARAGGDTPGFEFRLKGADRLKDKIAQQLEERDTAIHEALARIPDAVRYTIRIPKGSYVEGTNMAVSDLRSSGFQLVEGGWRNFWATEIYRGINSRWRDPVSGQLFEVQFHTPASVRAKETTHEAYERARLPELLDEELQEIDRIQSNVTTTVAVPYGADALHNEPDWRRKQ